ncbi:MAG: hypothetical protein RLZZ126_1384 [Pseudomonadota bacterium]|jgi:signal transduction histidine kinase
MFGCEITGIFLFFFRFLLIGLWVGSVAGQVAPARSEACTVHSLTDALRVVSVTDAGAQREIARGPVHVPDTLAASWRRESHHIRYELPLPPCVAAGHAMLWVYRIGAPYRIRAGTEALQAVLPLTTGKDHAYNGRVPALFVLPPQATLLHIELASLPYVGNGLLQLEVGTAESLASRASVAEDALTHFNNYASAVIGAFGGLALLAWVRRRGDWQIFWFAFACLAWALRGVAYQTFELRLHPLVMEQLNPTLLLAAMLGVYCSALSKLDRFSRRVRWRLGALAALPYLALLAAHTAGQGAPVARGLAFAIAFVLILDLPRQLWRDQQRNTLSGRLLLLGYACMLAGSIHDIGMVLGWVPASNWSFVTPGFSVFLLCHALAVSQYLVFTLTRAEHANDELERSIRAKTSQLEASYALLRDSERDAARTQEREHLLREMHDGLGAQLMTALRGVERGAMPREQVIAALQDSLDDLRLLMDTTDIGRELQGALAAWRNRWDPRLAALGITLDWSVAEDIDGLPLHTDAVLQIMRILQEATANAVKHAACDRIALRVSLDTTADQGHLQLRISDNGRGMPPQAGGGMPRPAGRGLRNMLNRAQLLGGSLDIRSLPAPGQGTQVSLTLPVPLTA